MTRVCKGGFAVSLAVAMASVGCLTRGTAGKASAAVAGPAPSAAADADAMTSVLLVHVDGVDTDWSAPWGAGKSWKHTLVGIPVEGQRIVIGGWWLRNQQHVEIQKAGAVTRSAAKVALFDADAGLAILTVDDAAFWSDVRTAPLATTLPRKGHVRIGHAALEGLRAEPYDGVITEFDTFGKFGFIHMKIEQVDVQHVGVSDVVMVDGRIAGVVMSAGSGDIRAIGSAAILDFVHQAAHPPYLGYAGADFLFQKLTNPGLRDSLGVGPQDGGVLVSRLLSGGSAEGALEVGDVLLSVDGTRIDSDGTFTHPTAGGHVLLFALFTEGHRPGDAVSVQLLRKGQRLTTKVVLKARPDDTTRVPWFQSSPRAFTIQGGLVFERLTREYLMTLGRDWESSAPTRLLEPYELDRWDSTPEREGIVVLTRALPVPSTLGYEHVRNLTVDRINDVAVRSLDDVRAAFGHPKGGFHVVTFHPGQDVARLVLDVDEARKADASVREKYQLENEIGPVAR